MVFEGTMSMVRDLPLKGKGVQRRQKGQEHPLSSPCAKIESKQSNVDLKADKLQE